MNHISAHSISKYRVIPRLVRIGVPQTVSILPLGQSMQFCDDTDYIVRFVPMEIYDDTYIERPAEFDSVTVRPQKGVITVTYTFDEEQEWILSIRTPEEEEKKARAREFHVYSLADDLYERNPYRGDLHAHSTGSDGSEEPAVVAANYRKEGFDFFALTDHHNWNPSAQIIDRFADVPIDIKLFLGEEVHLKGVIHIVSFGSRYSITERYRANAEEIHEKLKAEAETLTTPKGVNALEFAYRRWITEQIREAGGMCIVPHPFWIHKPGIYNMNTAMLDYIFKTGTYDAFELTGGQTVHENNLQIAFYQDQRAMGRQIPIVGSSDSHGTDQAVYFGMSQTVLFAKDTAYDAVCDAIRDLYSVAVEEVPGEEVRVHGPYRLVRYTRFLLNYYFPGHDELCVEEGRLMREYALGDTSAGDALRALSGRVKKYMDHTLRGV